MSGKSSGKAGAKQHGAMGFPLIAALLIAAGVVLLLYNFDQLPQGVWKALIRFWPVILFIIGVNIFLRSHPWIAGFLILLILVGAIVGAVLLANSDPQRYATLTNPAALLVAT